MKRTTVLVALCLLMPALASADMSISYHFSVPLDGSQKTTPYSWAAVETFEGTGSGGFVQSWTWGTVSGHAAGDIEKGLTVAQGAPPAGDGTFYFCVPEKYGALPGAATVADFGGPRDYLGLYWGSIDTYNEIHFYDAKDAVIGVVKGNQVIEAGGTYGDQYGSKSNRYVNVHFLKGETFTKVGFFSTQKAFEFDNVAVGVVPVPGAVLLGFLGLGYAGMRLRKMV